MQPFGRVHIRSSLSAVALLFLVAAPITYGADICSDATLDDLRNELRVRNFLHRARDQSDAISFIGELRGRKDATGDVDIRVLQRELEHRHTTLGQVPPEELETELAARRAPLAGIDMSRIRNEIAVRNKKYADITAEDLTNVEKTAPIKRELARRDAALANYGETDLSSELRRRTGALSSYTTDELSEDLRNRDSHLGSISTDAINHELTRRPTEFDLLTRADIVNKLADLDLGPRLSTTEITEGLTRSSSLAACSEATLLEAFLQTQARVIGEDDRTDIKNVSERLTQLKKIQTLTPEQQSERDLLSAYTVHAASIGAIVLATGIPCTSGTCSLATTPYANARNLCNGVAFSTQPCALPICTGFVIKQGRFVTSSHCLTLASSIDKLRIVFGYQVDQGATHTGFALTDVIQPKAVLERGTGSDDWVLLDIGSTDPHPPLSLGLANTNLTIGTRVYVMGYPDGLPLKAAANAQVRQNYYVDYFTADLDTFQGNSGSPVFDNATHHVQGVLRGGEPDYHYLNEQHCQVVNVCLKPDACVYEQITRITNLAAAVARH
jgi:V8-like Glu-specific endopeptidase